MGFVPSLPTATERIASRRAEVEGSNGAAGDGG